MHAAHRYLLPLLASGWLTACDHNDKLGPAGPDNPGTPATQMLGDAVSGKQVFRSETFGNEGFWTDALKLATGHRGRGRDSCAGVATGTERRRGRIGRGHSGSGRCETGCRSNGRLFNAAERPGDHRSAHQCKRHHRLFRAGLQRRRCGQCRERATRSAPPARFVTRLPTVPCCKSPMAVQSAIASMVVPTHNARLRHPAVAWPKIRALTTQCCSSRWPPMAAIPWAARPLG